MFVILWLSAMSKPILRYTVAFADVPVGTKERIDEAELLALSITPCPSAEMADHPAPEIPTVNDTHGDVNDFAESTTFMYTLKFAESVDGVNVHRYTLDCKIHEHGETVGETWLRHK